MNSPFICTQILYKPEMATWRPACPFLNRQNYPLHYVDLPTLAMA